MVDNSVIALGKDDYEIIDASEYRGELSEHFSQIPEVAQSLITEAQKQ